MTGPLATVKRVTWSVIRYVIGPFYRAFMKRLEAAVSEAVRSNVTALAVSGFAYHSDEHAQCALRLQANSATVSKRIEALKAGMDEDSRFQVDRYFKLFSILPEIPPDDVSLVFPLSMSIFTDEERLILANSQRIKSALDKRCGHWGVPIHLNSTYFESGLTQVPYGLPERLGGTVALDCGAWLGDSAFPMLRYGFDKVHCFEPLEETYAELVLNIDRNSLNDRVIAHNLAVGDKRGQLYITKMGGRGESSAVGREGAMPVQCTTIDDFCKNTGKPITVVKMDIEGMEMPALRGAEQTIRDFRPILLISVYHNWLDPAQVFSVKEFIESLKLGYEFRFRWLEPSSAVLYEHSLICYCKDQFSE